MYFLRLKFSIKRFGAIKVEIDPEVSHEVL